MYGVEQQCQVQHTVYSDKQKTNLKVELFADFNTHKRGGGEKWERLKEKKGKGKEKGQ